MPAYILYIDVVNLREETGRIVDLWFSQVVLGSCSTHMQGC
jgi:hypothetical protein